MSTLKLFHHDPYATTFAAQVISCTPTGGNWEVILDQTCFYATAGGQPNDLGDLGNQRVVDVREEEDGTIIHTVDGPLTGQVNGDIDWARRIDNMEQHTGQHLLSGVFERLLDAETVSWHLGTDSCTVDLDIETLSHDQVEHIERECSRVIQAALPVVTHFATSLEQLAALPLRKPPTVTENIRVVEISGYDWSACAGTHVRNSAEIGLIKIKSWERYKKNIRIQFLAGGRALRDYQFLDRSTRDLCRSLSIAAPDLSGYVQRAQEETSGLRKLVRSLQERLLEVEAAELLVDARKIGGARVVRHLFGGRPMEEVKLLAAKVAAYPGAVALFGTKGAIPQIVMHRAIDIRIDLGGVIRQVLPMIDGRGGGSPIQAQGGGSRPEGLELAIDQALRLIAEAL